MAYQRVLIPVRGDDCDRSAIELAATILAPKNVELRLVYVVEVAQRFPLEAELPDQTEQAERALDAASRHARSVFNGVRPSIQCELLQARSAGPAIVDEARLANADVIVMSLRNQRRHGRPAVGDTVPYILKNASCEVLIQRQPPVSALERCDWPPDIGNLN